MVVVIKSSPRTRRASLEESHMRIVAIGIIPVLVFAAVTASPAFARQGNIISMSTVRIGYAGNEDDQLLGHLGDNPGRRGGVDYEYNIGTYEVTIGEYAAFLNAVAADDPNGLYEPVMSLGPSSGQWGGLIRNGSAGSYTYSVLPGRERYSINNINVFRAERFANWMHNGQPTGAQNSSTTENGVYDMSNPTGYPLPTRQEGWRWALPNADEWYKAAYYQPASEQGDIDNYWLYTYQSNSPDIWPYLGNFDSTTTYPAELFPPNFFGAYDMGGSLGELLETPLPGFGVYSWRVGGSFADLGTASSADWTSLYPVAGRSPALTGFRMVHRIPAPGVTVAMGLGVLLTARRRR